MPASLASGLALTTNFCAGAAVAVAATAGRGRGAPSAAGRRFFEAPAEGGPAVLVFEDLHWGDEGLLDFVEELVDWAGGVPLLVVCSARPELLARRPGWGGGCPGRGRCPRPSRH